MSTQQPFLIFGSNSGTAQPVKSTLNALWVSLQGGSVTTIPFTINGPNLVAVSTDGLVIQNTTAATAGVPVQISPRSKWCGTAYNSVSTLSETDCFIAEVVPTTQAGTTQVGWKLSSSTNGGGYSAMLTVNNATGATLGSGLPFTSGAGVIAGTRQCSEYVRSAV